MELVTAKWHAYLPEQYAAVLPHISLLFLIHFPSIRVAIPKACISKAKMDKRGVIHLPDLPLAMHPQKSLPQPPQRSLSLDKLTTRHMCSVALSIALPIFVLH